MSKKVILSILGAFGIALTPSLAMADCVDIPASQDGCTVRTCPCVDMISCNGGPFVTITLKSGPVCSSRGIMDWVAELKKTVERFQSQIDGGDRQGVLDQFKAVADSVDVARSAIDTVNRDVIENQQRSIEQLNSQLYSCGAATSPAPSSTYSY